MNLDQITTKCWILALIIRDDGERLLLGDGWFDFKDSLQHFQPNSIANDIVELQGTDGQLLAGQVRRSASQSFDGYIGDALTSKTEIENRRRQFIQFFRTRRHYKVIYIFPDGTAIQRRMGYLTDAPSVPEMWQKFPEYHVALNFEDVNYYEYAEDAQGDEIYAHESLVKLISVQSGGLVWDEDGAVSHGYTWLDPQTVTGDYVTVTDGATGSPLTLSQLTGNAEQTTYSGKNLCDSSIENFSTYYASIIETDGALKMIANAGVSARVPLALPELTGGTTYTISFEVRGVSIADGGTFVRVREGSDGGSWISGRVNVSVSSSFTTGTIVFTPSSTVSPFLWFYLSPATTNTTNVEIYVKNIQLEVGNTATDYEPYVGGTASPNPSYPQPISTVTGEQTVRVTGKNLFDYASASDAANTTVTQYRVFAISGLEPNARYTISGQTVPQITDGNKFIYFWSASTYSGAERKASLKSASTFSFDANADGVIYLAISPTDTATWESVMPYLENAQLELGTTATAYEPYQEQSFTIDLGSIELAKIGTYQDRIYKDSGKWYVEKQLGKVVLDGSESWGDINNNALFYSGISDIYKPGANTTPYVMSNNYSPAPYQTMYSELVDYGVGAHDTQNRVLIRNKDCDSTSALKTWLGTNKPSVYYALATPTTTQITDETLLSQLNFIASLYEGVNNISIVGTGAQGEMTLNYYADVDTTGAGYEWESGEGGGPTIVQAIGVDDAQPIWTVTGPATNPTLTNITTVQTITWNGTVPNGQKLIVDMANQTATLAGANVYEFITGSWLTLRPGANKLTYSAQGADQASQIQWNGVVG